MLDGTNGSSHEMRNGACGTTIMRFFLLTGALSSGATGTEARCQVGDGYQSRPVALAQPYLAASLWGTCTAARPPWARQHGVYTRPPCF